MEEDEKTVLVYGGGNGIENKRKMMMMSKSAHYMPGSALNTFLTCIIS